MCYPTKYVGCIKLFKETCLRLTNDLKFKMVRTKSFNEKLITDTIYAKLLIFNLSKG